MAAAEFVPNMTLAPLPETERGYGIIMYASKQGKFAYANGKTVVIRDLADPSQATLYTEHLANVRVAAFSPNGEWIASGDVEGNVRVWSTLNGNLKNETVACGNVRDIAWSPDGKRICAVGGGAQDRAKVFAWDSGNNLGYIKGHSKDILSCSYRSERPFRIATASEDLSVKFHHGPPFKLDHGCNDHTRYANRVLYSPKGEYLISVGADSKILVFDGKTGEKTKELTSDDGHKGAIYSFDFSPDGTQILTVSSDKTAKIWNIEDSTVAHTFHFAEKPSVLDMQVGALWHGEYILTVSLSGAINYLDTANPNAPKRVIQGSKSNIQDMSFDAKNGKFFTSDTDGYLTVYDKATGTGSWFTGKGHSKTVNGAKVSCDGATVTTVSIDDTIRVNNVADLTYGEAEKLGGCPTPNGLATGPKSADLAVVTLMQDKVVVCRAGKVVSTEELKYTPTCVAISMDESRVAIGSKKNHVHVYSLEKDSLSLLFSYNKHTRPVAYLTFSPDGKYLTTVGKDKKIWNYPADGDKDSEPFNRSGWPFHSQTVNQICWSPDCSRPISAAQDERLIVWKDVQKWTGSRDAKLLVHKAGVSHISFWDNESVITTGGDRSIKYWTI